MSNQSTCFVILTEARTGSNLLVSLLDSHPDINCHSEVFHRKTVYAKPPLDAMSVEWRDAHVEEVLDAIFADKDRGERLLANGFKLFYYHKPKLILRLARDPKVKFIVLRRNDKLSQYSSRKIALKTGRWAGPKENRGETNSAADEKPRGGGQAKVKYSVWGHLTYSIFSELCYYVAMRVLAHFGAKTFQVRYEDLVTDLDGQMREVLSFLQLSEADLSTELERQNSPDVIDRFSNQQWARRSVAAQEKVAAFLRKFASQFGRAKSWYRSKNIKQPR